MSRRSKSNGSTSTVANTKNISHPNEFLHDHRQFLIRSLERNDTDMAALTDLNRSLHERKRAILDTCGEITLLDLGSGKYKLSPTGDSLEEAVTATATASNEKDKEPTASDEKDKKHSDTFPDEAGQELCVDFLLRMKLRRKLLNRLARRLNRVAHAMDGEDVSPPGPPKYGDLRLHVDPAQVQASEAHWQRQEAARRQLDQEREKHIYADEAEEEAKKWSTDQEEEHRLKYVSDDEKEKAKAKGAAEAEASSEKEASTSTDAKAAPLDQGEKSQEGTKEDEVKEKDNEEGKAEAATAEGKESAEKGETVKAEDKMEEDKKPDAAASDKAVRHIKVLDNVDYEALQEYSDSYEKVLDPATGTFTYTILDQNREEDHLAIKYGAGIGASHRSMSSKDKEAEWKRWQTSLLSRIPEQPTFEELGYHNRVFLMEERRKLALEELKAKTPKVEDMDMGDASPKKASEEDKDDSPTKASEEEKEDKKNDDDTSDEEKDDMDVDDKHSVDDAGSDDGKKGEDDKKVKDDEDLETDDKEEEESPSKKVKEDEDEKKADIVPKRNRPISLVPVPSFYEQDLKRIKMVHAELMAASIQDHARRRLEEVTRDYNGGKSPAARLIDFVHLGLAFSNHSRSISQLYRHRMRLSNVVNGSRISSTVSFTRTAGK
jgi:hypothetical protein